MQLVFSPALHHHPPIFIVWCYIRTICKTYGLEGVGGRVTLRGFPPSTYTIIGQQQYSSIMLPSDKGIISGPVLGAFGNNLLQN